MRVDGRSGRRQLQLSLAVANTDLVTPRRIVNFTAGSGVGSIRQHCYRPASSSFSTALLRCDAPCRPCTSRRLVERDPTGVDGDEENHRGLTDARDGLQVLGVDT